MVSPINYNLDVQAPFSSAIQGFQLGAQTGAAMQTQRKAEETQRLTLQQQALMQQDLRSIISNPAATPRDFANLTLKYPSFAAPFKDAAALMSADQKENTIKFESQIHAALDGEAYDVAKDMLKKRVEAMHNSGDSKGAEDYERAIKLIDVNPTVARNMMASKLVGMDDKLAGSLSSLGSERRANAKFPTDMRKERAETVTAEATAGIKTVEAANAPTKVGLENENARSVINDRVAGQEIAQGQLGVAQENAMTTRGGLALDQQKLAATQGEKKQGDALAAQDALDSANALIGQIKGVQNHPGLNAGTGTMSGIRSYFNSTDANDFRKSVEGLKSPVFLNELGKLKTAGITLGQVTEAEGKKLEQRIANLDPDQSTPSFKNQVGILLKDTEKFIAKIQAGGKLPTSGGAYLFKDPKFGNISEGDINYILSKRPQFTREDAIRALKAGTSGPGGASGGY